MELEDNWEDNRTMWKKCTLSRKASYYSEGLWLTYEGKNTSKIGQTCNVTSKWKSGLLQCPMRYTYRGVSRLTWSQTDQPSQKEDSEIPVRISPNHILQVVSDVISVSALLVLVGVTEFMQKWVVSGARRSAGYQAPKLRQRIFREHTATCKVLATGKRRFWVSSVTNTSQTCHKHPVAWIDRSWIN